MEKIKEWPNEQLQKQIRQCTAELTYGTGDKGTMAYIRKERKACQAELARRKAVEEGAK